MVMVSIKELHDDTSLLHHPDFHEGLKEALEDYAARRVKSLSEVKANLGLPKHQSREGLKALTPAQ